MPKRTVMIFISVLMLVTHSVVVIGEPTQQDDYFQVVFDTTHSVADGYTTGFGYSVYVSYDGIKFLFDTGEDGDTLLSNLKRASVDLNKLAFIVISHDHSDHAGGLAAVRALHPEVKVYAAPGHEVGVDDAQFVMDQIMISPNIHILRTHTEQPTAGISDELSLLLITKQGPYLFTACSHTGLTTIVDKAMAVAGTDIFYYTGGARLSLGSEQNTSEVANALKARRVAHVSPGHCSVSHAVDRVFKQSYPSNYTSSRLGEKMPLETVN